MRIHPDTLDVRLDRNDYNSSTRLSWRSRRYELHYALELRDRWGDPRPLVEFVERFVGGTFAAWEQAGVSTATGRDMAHALMPHFESEIHRFMERLEREGRRRERGPAYWDEAARIRPDQWAYLSTGGFYGGDWGTPEDPKAKEKARQLLMRNLDDGQLKSFKKDGWFKVTAKDGKAYTISTARSFNVKAEDGTKYCGQLADTPIEDQMLAQKLLLQHEPEKFFKNANVSPAMPTGSDGARNMTAMEIMMRQQQGMANPSREQMQEVYHRLQGRAPWV